MIEGTSELQCDIPLIEPITGSHVTQLESQSSGLCCPSSLQTQLVSPVSETEPERGEVTLVNK